MLLTRPLCSSDAPLYLSPSSTPASRLNALSTPVQRDSQPRSTLQLDRCIDKIVATHFAADTLSDPVGVADALKRTQPVHLRSSDCTIEAISKAYAETCTLLWRSLLVSIPSSALASSIQQLQIIWASARDCSPNDRFFAKRTTLAAELNEKWRSPHVQAALREATTQLLGLPADASTGRYPSSWAYLCGCVMYQLLQWNHQLTPETLRELFS